VALFGDWQALNCSLYNSTDSDPVCDRSLPLLALKVVPV